MLTWCGHICDVKAGVYLRVVFNDLNFLVPGYKFYGLAAHPSSMDLLCTATFFAVYQFILLYFAHEGLILLRSDYMAMYSGFIYFSLSLDPLFCLVLHARFCSALIFQSFIV